MMLLSHLSPETITEINLDDEEEESEEIHAASTVCLSPQCKTTISGTVCLQLHTFNCEVCHIFLSE